MNVFAAYGSAFVIGAVCIAAVWLLSIPLRNVSIIDVWWGLGFAVMAGVYAAAHGWTLRSMYILALISVWGVRLASYLFWRNHIAQHGKEDHRYAKMRAKVGDTFWWQSAYLVFAPQLIAQFLVSTPLLMAMASPASDKAVPTPGGAVLQLLLDALGLAVVGVGLYFEVVGDRQLTAFKAKPENAGQLCTVGLWRATRHPNYFGSALLWWGFWLMAVAASGWAGVATVFSPILMQFCLMAVTGVTLLERTSSRKKPGFDEYAKHTPAFYPDIRKLFS